MYSISRLINNLEIAKVIRWDNVLREVKRKLTSDDTLANYLIQVGKAKEIIVGLGFCRLVNVTDVRCQLFLCWGSYQESFMITLGEMNDCISLNCITVTTVAIS